MFGRLAKFTLIMWSIPGLAGTWTGAGGELLQDSLNPWFVRRSFATERLIRYCIEVDEANFGVGRRKLSRHVRSALDYWYREFIGAYNPDTPHRFFVGLDTFGETQCSNNPELRFQFGVLSSDQLQKMSEKGWDPKRYAGMSIRTDYSEHMQGRGFIYISPPRGPLAMESENIRQNPWSDYGGEALQLVLRHELGHVFGLPHDRGKNTLMGSGLPQYAISNDYFQYTAFPSYFRPASGAHVYYSCFGSNAPGNLVGFFGMKNDDECLMIKVTETGLQVFADGHDDEERLLGSILPVGTRMITPIIRIYLWLTEGNKLFPNLSPSTQLIGPYANQERWAGSYETEDGTIRRSVAVETGPGEFRMSGYYNGKIFLDISDLWFR